MDSRKLGQGLTVSELELGCMGMSKFQGTGDEAESIATIHRTLELGITPLDTADMYSGTNEQLVSKAIAWLLAQGDDIVPIPGTKRCTYLEENVAAMDITLTRSELERIDEVAPKNIAAGDRYADMSSVNR